MIELALGISREAAQPTYDTVSIPTQKDFNALSLKFRRSLHAITGRLADDSSFDLGDWFDQFDAILLDGHTSAYEMGRHLAGDLTDDVNDLLRGMAARDAESYYVRGFVQALVDLDPRYWDAELKAWRVDAIKARQDLYLGKLRGTANDAFVSKSPADLNEWYWRLGGAEEHCEECPQIADLSPFTADTLFTKPGHCDTPCRMNCLCHLERVDGVVGFKRVEL